MRVAPPTPRDVRTTVREGAKDFAVVAVSIGVIAVLIKLVWRGFTFWGDNAESFFPLWHMYGTALRSGEPFLFDVNGWGAANVVGEAAYGVFNPVTVVNSILMSFSDNLSLMGFFVIVEFLVFFGWGVYMLARTYGAGRPAAVLVGAIAPFAGYTLFYEAGNWASGLMSIVWVTHFWWSARTYAGGRIGPLTPVIFGLLAITVGNPYSVVGVLVVLFAVGLELLIARNVRRFLGLVVVGLVVGTGVLLTYLALVYALPQIDRPVDGALVSNTNYLTPSLSDLLGLSAPTYLPRITAWYNTHDLVPSTYLSWIILPVLPWLRWRAAGRWRGNASLLIASLVFLLLTLGPDRLWLFRWPIRFVEYFYLGLIVVFAMLLSHGFASDRIRRRLAFSVFAVGVGLYLSVSSTPNLASSHAGVTVLILLLAIAVVFGYRRFGLRGVAAVAIVGTAFVAPVQGLMFGWSHQSVVEGVDQTPPNDLSVVREASAPLTGRILQVSELETLYGTDAVATGSLVFGNIGAAAGLDILNRYTGINFEKFKDGMAFDYRGTVGDWFSLGQLWTDVSDDMPVPVIDALGIDTLVVQADRRDVDTLPDLAVDWTVVEQDDHRLVLQRREPLGHPVLFSPDDVAITNAAAEGNDLSFDVSAPDGGKVLVDRLAWAGFHASIDGEPLTIETAPYGLMVIDLPAGTEGTVEVDYTVPGLALGSVLVGVGLLIAMGHQVLWWRRRPEAVSDPSLNIADERDVESSYEI